MDKTFLIERIATKKAQIEAWEDALLALSSGAIESYKLDTGQSVQTVKKQDVDKLQDLIDGLYNSLVILEARLNGGNVIQTRPAW